MYSLTRIQYFKKCIFLEFFTYCPSIKFCLYCQQIKNIWKVSLLEKLLIRRGKTLIDVKVNTVISRYF